MLINKVYESEVGTVVFHGELEGPTLETVIKIGLLTLVARGAIQAEVVPPQGEQH